MFKYYRRMETDACLCRRPGCEGKTHAQPVNIDFLLDQDHIHTFISHSAFRAAFTLWCIQRNVNYTEPCSNSNQFSV